MILLFYQLLKYIFYNLNLKIKKNNYFFYNFQNGTATRSGEWRKSPK